MFETIPVPQKGDRVTAVWGAAVANGINALTPFAAAHGLVRQGVGNGTEPLPENRRNRTKPDEDYPWKVYAFAQGEDVDHCFEIYIPEGSLHVGETEVTVEGVTAISSGRYTVDCEGEIDEDGQFILVVYREAESSGSSSSGDVAGWKAEIVSTEESVEDAGEILAILPIADVSIDDEGDDSVGKVELQYIRSAIALPVGDGHAIIGDTQSSETISGDLEVSGMSTQADDDTSCGITFTTTRGSTNQTTGVTTPARIVADVRDRDATETDWGAHKLEYTDSYGTKQTAHVLGSADIDVSHLQGKLIRDVSCSQTSEYTTVRFTYTDGTFTEFTIQNGSDGSPGLPGQDGDAPEITSERSGDRTLIYADGELIATVADGSTPVITMGSGTGAPKVYPIYSNGVQIGSVRDGEDGSSSGSATEQAFITDISFALSGDKLVATVKKKKFKAIELGSEETDTVDVCDAKQVDVVTSESYSTSTHQLTNTRRRITVLADTSAVGQTPFTATALTSE